MSNYAPQFSPSGHNFHYFTILPSLPHYIMLLGWTLFLRLYTNPHWRSAPDPLIILVLILNAHSYLMKPVTRLLSLWEIKLGVVSLWLLGHLITSITSRGSFITVDWLLGTHDARRGPNKKYAYYCVAIWNGIGFLFWGTFWLLDRNTLGRWPVEEVWWAWRKMFLWVYESEDELAAFPDDFLRRWFEAAMQVIVLWGVVVCSWKTVECTWRGLEAHKDEDWPEWEEYKRQTGYRGWGEAGRRRRGGGDGYGGSGGGGPPGGGGAPGGGPSRGGPPGGGPPGGGPPDGGPPGGGPPDDGPPGGGPPDGGPPGGRQPAGGHSASLVLFSPRSNSGRTEDGRAFFTKDAPYENYRPQGPQICDTWTEEPADYDPPRRKTHPLPYGRQ